MKKIYAFSLKLFFLQLLVVVLSLNTRAQSLVAGDIAILGLNCDPNASTSKTFSIVALSDLAAGQVIYFSDKAYYSNAFGPLLGAGTEGRFSWTTPVGGVGKGTSIMFTVTSGASPSVTTTPSTGTTTVLEGWTATSGNTSPFGANGDSMLIYQGSEALPTFIFGFNSGNNITGVTNGWNTGLSTNPNGACELPSTLTSGLTAIGFGGAAHIDNLRYNGTVKTGTKATLLALIANTSNWISDDVNEYNFTPATGVFSGTTPNFTIGGANTAPTATSVANTGTLITGQTLTGSYTYTDAESNAESGSTFKWYRSDDASGTNKAAISSATSTTYVLVAGDVGKYISFEVTPRDGSLNGTAVESSKRGPVTLANTAPTATVVTSTGTLITGQTLTGSYTYADAESNAESGSTYKWYRSDDASGTNKAAISSATSLTYVLVSGDVGKYISFEVTPRDGSLNGTAVESTRRGPITLLNTAPTATVVANTGTLITGQTLTGNYTYTDAESNAESGSTFKWYRSDDAAGTNKAAIGSATATTYVLVAGDVGKYISFEVTPRDGSLSGTAVESSRRGPVTLLNTAPTVTSVTNTGTLTTGQTLTGSYTYTDAESNAESGSTFKWYRSDDAAGTNKAAISLSTATTYVLAAGDVGKYISFEVTPRDGSLSGTAVESSRRGPVTLLNTAPTATVVANTGTLITGQTLTGSYTYTDAESNAESGSIFKWYRSDDAAGTNKAAIGSATATTYVLVAGDVGKYISFEVTPRDGSLSGTAVESSRRGPVTLLNTAPAATSVTNTGTLITGQTLTGSYTYTDGESNAESGSTYKWYRSDDAAGTNKAAISLATATTYVLAAGDVGKYISFEVTPRDGSLSGTAVESSRRGPVTLLNTAPTATVVANTGTLITGQTLTGSYTYTDAESNAESGSIFKWYRSDDAAGTNKAAIGSATATTYVLVAGDVGKYISFEVTPRDGSLSGTAVESSRRGPVTLLNTAPAATSVTNTGTLITGQTLTGSYTYTDGESNAESGSTYKWYRSDDAAGTNKAAISLATATTYVLVAGDVGKYISFEVTPRDGSLSGTAVESSRRGPVTLLNTAPTVTSVTNTGTLTTGQTLTGSYTYTDAESNAESGSTFKWYRSDDAAGTNKAAISLATATTYVLVAGDVGKYISFEVTPRDGSLSGTAVESSRRGPVTVLNTAPTATVVANTGTLITGQTLTGSYTYTDAESNAESGSTFRWYRSDDAAGTNKAAISLSTATTYVLVAGDVGKYISFEVTPRDGSLSGTGVESSRRGPVTVAMPLISTSGTIAALNTIYGSPSANGSFNISGTDMTSGVTITAPTGFEVSTNSGTGFANQVIVGAAGTISSTIIYVRLKSTASVGLNPYSGNISLTSTGATTQTIAIANSSVSAKLLTLTLNALPAISKTYDGLTDATIASGNYSLNGVVFGDLVTVSGTANYDTKHAGTDKTITVNSFVLAGVDKDNYSLTTTSASTTGSISTKTITVSAVAKNKTYGDADPALTYMSSPVLAAGDSFTGALSRAVGENIGDYAIGQGSLALSTNYTLNYISANLSIGKKTIAVSAVAKNKTYGDADPALTYTSSPALATGDSFTGALSRAVGENIGDYAIGQGSLALNTNYTLNYTGANLSIGKKTIAVSAVAKNKTYGDADPELTYTSSPVLVTGDSFTGALSRAVGENIGDYAIGQGSLALNTNYTLNYTGANLTIGKKTITVTAASKTKVYGDADPALTYISTPALVTGDSFTGGLSRAVGENIGDYAIGQGTLALSTNYTLNYTSANQTIGKKTIAVSAVAKGKTYGDVDPALTYTSSPALVTGDSFTGALSRAVGENIGDYAIGQGTLTLSTNYTLNYMGANLSIGKKTIAVSAVAKNKTYGDADPALTYTSSPALVTGDSFTGGLSRAVGENIGDYAIGQGSLALNTNYTLNYTGANLTIGKKTITVSAVAKNKIYGDADPALTYTSSPALATGDSFTGSLTRALGENIGDYAIGQGTLTLSTNYTLNYTGANLSIGKKTIAVSAVAKNKTYGDADPALTYTSSPALATGDSFTGALTRMVGENIGDYAIGQGSLALSTNYTLNYTGADLSIGKKTIAVSAVAKNKTYGDADPALTYTSSPALATGDSFTGGLSRAVGENIGDYAIGQGTLALSTNYTLNYTGKNLTIGKKTIAVTAASKTKVYGDADPALTYTSTPALATGDSFTGGLSRAVGENIGDYAIGQGSLAVSTNYTLVYTGANLTIGKKTIAVSAAAKTKAYGDPDPVITYTSSPALATGDSFTGALSRAVGENIGDYAIGQGTLALSTNYTLNYTGANLTIGKKTIAVSAVAKNKTYGDADPTLTYTSTPSLITGDSFTGALSRALGENIGDYAIGQGSLALSTNYTLNYTGANLSVGKKTITVSAVAKNKTYGEVDPALTYTSTPALITGDSFTGVLSRAVGENVGDYAVNQGTLALSTNYTLNYTGANLTIGKKTITVTAAAKTKIYGDVDPTLTYTFAPLLVTGDTFSGNLTRAAGVNIGNYAINQGSLALSSNYTISYVGANLTIGVKTIDVIAVAKSKSYGDSDPVFTYTFSPALITGDSFIGELKRAAGENVGTYAINMGTVAVTPNYQLLFAPANLVIGKKDITVTLEAKSKVYGSADPVLSYSVSPALSSGDTFSGSPARAAGENAGQYTINAGTLALNNNYNISYATGILTISPKAITVAANANSKTYGDSDPQLSYTATGLIGSDVLTGSLGRMAGENAGSYPIVQGSLSGNGNYAISFSGNALTIDKRALLIRADDKSKSAGTANPVLTATITGFASGENSSVLTAQPVLSTTATAASAKGSYPITASGAAAANYAIGYQNGTLTVADGVISDIIITSTPVYEGIAIGTGFGQLRTVSDSPAAVFTYSLVGGTGSTDNGLFAISGSFVQVASALDYETRANYSIRIRSTDQNGLSFEKSFIINLIDVNEAPTLAAIANQSICTTTADQVVSLTGITAGPETGQTVSLSVFSSNASMFSSLTVSRGAGTTGTLNYKLAPGAQGTVTITVTANDNGGISFGGVESVTQRFVLTVNALPTVAIASDKGTAIFKGETAVLTATGGTSYTWANASGIVSGQTTAVLTVKPDVTTTYTVTASNASGCSDTRSITLTVTDLPVEQGATAKATNIMSPNGDGVNDAWVVEDIDLYPNNSVRIVDRAGRLVYEKKGYDNTWDATLRGAPLAEGTYYYIIDFGDGKTIKKGFITILRKK